MMLVGFVVAIGWRQLGWNKQLYEGAPGILSALLIYFIATRLTGSKNITNETLDHKSP